jgi:hypothetical protein
MNHKLCPISQAVATTGMADNARRHGNSLPATRCLRDRCAWWSEKHQGCAVVALLEVAESSATDTAFTEPAQATTEAPQKPQEPETELKPVHEHVKGWLRSLRSP